MRTSLASSAAAASTLRPRRASTSATYAASGSAKREAVTSLAMIYLVNMRRSACATLAPSKTRKRAARCWSGRRKEAGVVDQVFTDHGDPDVRRQRRPRAVLDVKQLGHAPEPLEQEAVGAR